ncbi:MAG: CCA tRNA nucleotidyltransferase [Candidatus Micrarchaeia archaeon]
MAQKMHKLLERVRERIRPSKQELDMIKKSEIQIRKRLAKTLPKDVEIVVCGSIAKGTALKNNRDLDLFLLFSKKYTPEQVKKLGVEMAKKAMKGYKTELNYAQHPYLKVYMDEIKVDIVPSSKIENNESIKTAVDRSQLHTQWANERLNEKMRDDVRLLKQFCKNIGIYGAQSRVEGFSGYLCEILIINYGSFEALLSAAAKYKEPVIDIENFHGEKRAKEMFAKAAMVVIDPTDKKRNVAAVVSKTSLSRFIIEARDFLKQPSEAHFFREKEVHSAKKLKQMIDARKTHTLLILMPAPALVEDVLWPQLKKATQAILAHLQKAEFRAFGHYFYSDGEQIAILIETMEKDLPAVKHVQGPQVFEQAHVQAFAKKHKNALSLHIEHERIVAIEKRKLTNAKQAIEDAIKNADKVGIPPQFEKAFAKRKYFDAYYLLKNVKMREIASDYFSRKL